MALLLCLKQEPVLNVQDLPMLLEHISHPSAALGLLKKVNIYFVLFWLSHTFDGFVQVFFVTS